MGDGRWRVLAGGPRGLVDTFDTFEEAEALARRTAARTGVRLLIQPNPLAVARALGVDDGLFVRQLQVALQLDAAGLLRR